MIRRPIMADLVASASEVPCLPCGRNACITAAIATSGILATCLSARTAYNDYNVRTDIVQRPTVRVQRPELHRTMSTRPLFDQLTSAAQRPGRARRVRLSRCIAPTTSPCRPPSGLQPVDRGLCRRKWHYTVYARLGKPRWLQRQLQGQLSRWRPTMQCPSAANVRPTPCVGNTKSRQPELHHVGHML